MNEEEWESKREFWEKEQERLDRFIEEEASDLELDLNPLNVSDQILKDRRFQSVMLARLRKDVLENTKSTSFVRMTILLLLDELRWIKGLLAVAVILLGVIAFT